MALPNSVAICSFRLGGTDGVSIEAAKWRRALQSLGCAVRTVAGSGPVDVTVQGLQATDSIVPRRESLEEAFAGAELVIVENLCSLPLWPAASAAVAEVLDGRPAILHHHDLASERAELAHFGPPPNNRRWLHVCISDRARRELSERGYQVVTCYNTFDTDQLPGNRDATRALLGIGATERLVLQPTRAIARKNVAGGIAIAHAVHGSYWLTGAVEDGYGSELNHLLSSANVPVLRQSMPGDGPADAYAACDLVALPSTWEGFGNPALEAAIYRRPLAIGHYPVAEELRTFGFQWLDASDPDGVQEKLETIDSAALERNAAIAAAHFSFHDLPGRLAGLLEKVMAFS